MLEKEKVKGKSNTELAQDRTDLAKSRTLLAGERTYSAWIRTGFTIAGAGLTIGKALQDTGSGTIALIVGGALITIGMLTFVYAWIGYRAVYQHLLKNYGSIEENKSSFNLNMTAISFITISLLMVCILGFWIMLS
ncbi:YidH family protein [Pisciglobus halotolerans]|uniref:DUF202 domain-containing protein n=1 Tax=Pisciglobus halotolerans TaxID=745365 RepID=A0A1I3CMH0_9LACT|nr:DUF202 domain-containing protein [Pisciglobus halotolerans]SFH75770.1 protein of unknown function [Pisciglobus halotolerans]